MTSLGITLVLLSAVLHAAWNTYSKSFGNPVSFLYWAMAWSVGLYVPLFVAGLVFAPFPPAVWGLVSLSGAVAGVYFVGLALAYRDGLVSVAYPLARAFPILVVTWAGMFLGEIPSVHGLVGVILVVVGCFFLPFQRFGGTGGGPVWRAYLTRSAFWALVAAVATSIFSIVDKVASVRMAELAPSTAVLAKLNYVYVQNLVTLVVFTAWCRLPGMKVQRVPRLPAALVGLTFLVSYGLVMVAFSSDPVAYVVAFRQISIVLTTAASMLFIEKQFSWPRMVGAAVIMVGVVLVALG